MNAPIPMGSVALALAQAGMHVFPVWPGQKRPATKTGLKSATRNPKKISSWWSKIPTANVGIATGPSGLVVIDLDAGKPWPLDGEPPVGVKAGDDVLLGIAEDAGAGSSWLWDVPSVVTPSGGLHLYFRAPAEGIVRSRANVAPWIDVRALGGYVVGPFSRTKVGSYRPSGGWEQVVEVDVGKDLQPVGIPAMTEISFDVPALPDWLADLVVDKEPAPTDVKVVSILDQIRARLDRPGVTSTSAYALTALERELDLVRSAVNGTRNETLNRSSFALGTLVGAGLLDETEVANELDRAARAVGLDDDEIAKTMRSGLSKGRANPRQVTTT